MALKEAVERQREADAHAPQKMNRRKEAPIALLNSPQYSDLLSIRTMERSLSKGGHAAGQTSERHGYLR